MMTNSLMTWPWLSYNDKWSLMISSSNHDLLWPYNFKLLQKDSFLNSKYSQWHFDKFDFFVHKTPLDHDTHETKTNNCKNDLKWNSNTKVIGVPIL